MSEPECDFPWWLPFAALLVGLIAVNLAIVCGWVFGNYEAEGTTLPEIMVMFWSCVGMAVFGFVGAMAIAASGYGFAELMECAKESAGA